MNIIIELNKEKWVSHQLDGWTVYLNKHHLNIRRIDRLSDLDSFMVPHVRCRLTGTVVEEVIFSSGVVRQCPLFYHVASGKFTLSDDCFLLKNMVGARLVTNGPAHKQFNLFGFCFSDNTLFDGVKGVEPGVTLRASSNGLETFSRYRYGEIDVRGVSRRELSREIGSCLDDIFDGVIKLLNGRRVIVPLSAGYDSRLIVAMLKKGGVKDVECYTWGTRDHKDTKIAEQTAHRLGYKWTLVDHSKSEWDALFEEPWLPELLRRTSNATNTFGCASLLFQRFLRKENIRDAIIIPGHAADFISGGHNPKSMNESSSYGEVASMIYDFHCLWPKGDFRDQDILQEIENSLLMNQKPYRSFDYWDMKERQSKFIVGSNLLYEDCGNSCVLPFWDYKFVHLWDTVDLGLKRGSCVYYDYLEEHIFSKMNIHFGNKPRSILGSAIYRLKYNRITQKTVGRLLRVKANDEFNFRYSLKKFRTADNDSVSPRSYSYLAEYIYQTIKAQDEGTGAH